MGVGGGLVPGLVCGGVYIGVFIACKGVYLQVWLCIYLPDVLGIYLACVNVRW